MDKIYLKDNYIVTELGGIIAVFPKNYSSYSENASGFYINSTFPVNNQRTVFVDFTRVTSVYNEAGTVAYSIATLRSFLLLNTGFKSPSGGSGGSTITVGTTPVTSGTDGSILMQKTGKVENSIIYENGLGDVIIPTVSSGAIRGLVVGGTTRNSNMALTLYNSLSIKKGGALYLERSDGQNNLALGYSTTGFNLTIGAPASTTGFIYFNKQNTTNIAAFDVNLGHFGIGTNSPQARLDVRAQGALSTDIAFRVRNSADTANLYSIDGLGNVIFNASSGSNPFIWNHAGTLQMKLEVAGNSGLLRVYNNGVLRHDIDGRDYASFKGIKINGVGGGVNFLNIGSAVSNSKFNVDIAGDPILDVFNSTNLNVIRFDSRGGEGAIQVRTVSSPTTSIVDGFKQYSADIVAGNAAPHFRTENGNIIRLFRGAALTASDGTLANAVTRIAELEARLQAHGLIA